MLLVLRFLSTLAFRNIHSLGFTSIMVIDACSGVLHNLLILILEQDLLFLQRTFPSLVHGSFTCASVHSFHSYRICIVKLVCIVRIVFLFNWTSFWRISWTSFQLWLYVKWHWRVMMLVWSHKLVFNNFLMKMLWWLVLTYNVPDNFLWKSNFGRRINFEGIVERLPLLIWQIGFSIWQFELFVATEIVQLADLGT